MLEQISYVFALTVLSYASICDLKTREVSNKLWMIVWPAGFALSALNIIFGDLTVSALALSVGISTILGIATAYFGLFGGADMKALIFIGLIVPAFLSPISLHYGISRYFPSDIILSNARSASSKHFGQWKWSSKPCGSSMKNIL